MRKHIIHLAGAALSAGLVASVGAAHAQTASDAASAPGAGGLLWTLAVAVGIAGAGFAAARTADRNSMVCLGIGAAVFAAINLWLLHHDAFAMRLLAAAPIALLAGWAAVGPEEARPLSPARRLGAALVGIVSFALACLLIFAAAQLPVVGPVVNGLVALHGDLYAWSTSSGNEPSSLARVMFFVRVTGLLVASGLDFIIVYGVARGIGVFVGPGTAPAKA